MRWNVMVANKTVLLACGVATYLVAVSTVTANPAITYTSKAAPLARILEEVAAKTGETYRLAPALHDEIVLARLREVTPEVFRARLAAALSARWDREGTAWVLVPNPSARQQELVEERNALIERLRHQIANLAQESGPGDPDPWDQAGLAFLRAVGPEVLADIPRGARVVFATSPNRMQRPLPSAVLNFVPDIVRKHNEGVDRDALENRPREQEEIEFMNMMRRMGLMPPDLRRIETPPAKMVVVVSNSVEWWSRSLFVKGYLFDAEGRLLAYTDDMGSLGLDSWLDAMNEEEEQEVEPDPTPKIQVSETAAAYELLLTESFMREDHEEVPAEILALGARPDLHEPLSFGVSEMILGVAEHHGWNVIASVPDRLLVDLIVNHITVRECLADLDYERMAIDTDGDWWLLRSKTAASDRLRRTNRAVLAEFITQARNQGTVTLEVLAQFALAVPAFDVDEFAFDGLLSQVAPGYAPLSISQMNPAALRFYGSLLPTQRGMIRAGNAPVAWSGMDANARGRLMELLFGAATSLVEHRPELARTEEQPLEAIYQMMGGLMGMHAAPLSSYRTEPTELFLGGMAPVAVVSGLVMREPVVTTRSSEGLFGVGEIGVTEMAMLKLYEGLIDEGEIASELGELQMAERTTVTLVVEVIPGVYARYDLRERSAPSGGRFVWGQFPSEFQAAVDARLGAIRNSPLGQLLQAGAGRPSRIPPPTP